jgi:hypothetical protein
VHTSRRERDTSTMLGLVVLVVVGIAAAIVIGVTLGLVIG